MPCFDANPLNLFLRFADMRILFRVAISEKVGSGHFMRSLALAQACQDNGGFACFITSKALPKLLRDRLQSEKIEHKVLSSGAEASKTDAMETLGWARKLGADWIWLDGYIFPEKYQAELKQKGLRVAIMDDFGHLKKYVADFIINPNGTSLLNFYAKASQAEPLVGPAYVLFRRQIAKMRSLKNNPLRPVKNILLTLGGSDPENLTLKLLDALRHLKPKSIRVCVLVGSLNPNLNKIKSLARSLPFPVEVIHNANDPGLAAILTKTDIAISAAGSTAWELALYRIPSLLIQTATNQKFLLQTLTKAGACLNLGPSKSLRPSKILGSLASLIKNSEKHRQMVKSCQGIVDSKGSQRILSRLDERQLKLRKVRSEDARKIWKWANAPEVRAISFSQDAIPWTDHIRWFRKKLKDRSCFFWMAQLGSHDIGQIRYERQESQVTVSLVLDPKWRNRGYGNDLLRKSLYQVFQNRSIRQAEAFTLIKNAKSSELFRRSGFQEKQQVIIQGQKALRFTINNYVAR